MEPIDGVQVTGYIWEAGDQGRGPSLVMPLLHDQTIIQLHD
ncbi:MAG TPA: hypothetical protein VKR06_06995 [Ktedonosporobacter sp.]|nr:hypothetical protein [Ktedonosporobacter sp.]